MQNKNNILELYVIFVDDFSFVRRWQPFSNIVFRLRPVPSSIYHVCELHSIFPSSSFTAAGNEIGVFSDFLN